MDQSFSAGVGNWVADEILHLARVHPATPAGMLTDEQVEAMWTSMKEVVNTAVEANADHSKFPKRMSKVANIEKRISRKPFRTCRLAIHMEVEKGQKGQVQKDKRRDRRHATSGSRRSVPGHDC